MATFDTLECLEPFFETWYTCNPLYCPEVQAPTVMRTIMLSVEVLASQGNCLTLPWNGWPRNNPYLEQLSLTPCVFMTPRVRCGHRHVTSPYRNKVIPYRNRVPLLVFNHNTCPCFCASLWALLNILEVAVGCPSPGSLSLWHIV